MEKSYKRNENIDELIQSVKLPYLSWKVLFLVDEALDVTQIAEMLETDISEVDTALLRLIENDLVMASAKTEPNEALPETEPVANEPEQDETFKIPEPEVIHPRPEPEEQTPEYPEPEETTELPISMVSSEIPDIMETESGEPVLDLQEEPLEAAAVSEMEGLDVDFATETETPPVDTASEAAIKESASQPSKAPSRKTILVVDDSIVIRKMVEIALEDENYNIDTAVSGKEGLSKIDRINPDLVILDLMLPDINGIDILKTVKASRGIPVIMLSGKDSPQMVEKAKISGADAFLPKPFKDDELIEKIKTLLNV